MICKCGYTMREIPSGTNIFYKCDACGESTSMEERKLMRLRIKMSDENNEKQEAKVYRILEWATHDLSTGEMMTRAQKIGVLHADVVARRLKAMGLVTNYSRNGCNYKFWKVTGRKGG